MIMCFGVWWQWIAVGVIAVVAVVLVFGRGHCGRGRCEGRSSGGKIWQVRIYDYLCIMTRSHRPLCKMN